MDESTKQACLTSIRKRALFLMDCGAGKSTAETRTGLLDAAMVLHLLACRWRSEAAPLKASAHPAFAEDRMTALMLNFTGHSWYVAYCNAALEIAEAMQDAVKAGELTLRSPMTRAKLRGDDLEGWLNADLRAKAKAAQIFPACAVWNPRSREWPDECLYPTGLVEPEEVMRWAAKSGIAKDAELRKLLGMEAQEQPAEPQPAPAAQVKPVSRFEAQEAEILAAIRAAGHDPLSVPKMPTDARGGIKAVIRGNLVGKSKLFPKGGSQFDKAWVRLRADGRIAS